MKSSAQSTCYYYTFKQMLGQLHLEVWGSIKVFIVLSFSIHPLYNIYVYIILIKFSVILL